MSIKKGAVSLLTSTFFYTHLYRATKRMSKKALLSANIVLSSTASIYSGFFISKEAE